MAHAAGPCFLRRLLYKGSSDLKAECCAIASPEHRNSPYACLGLADTWSLRSLSAYAAPSRSIVSINSSR